MTMICKGTEKEGEDAVLGFGPSDKVGVEMDFKKNANKKLSHSAGKITKNLLW